MANDTLSSAAKGLKSSSGAGKFSLDRRVSELSRCTGPGTLASSSSTASLGERTHLKQRCFSSCATLGRLAGSFSRHMATTSCMSCTAPHTHQWTQRLGFCH